MKSYLPVKEELQLALLILDLKSLGIRTQLSMMGHLRSMLRKLEW
jgi:hypothetical protein